MAFDDEDGDAVGNAVSVDGRYCVSEPNRISESLLEELLLGAVDAPRPQELDVPLDNRLRIRASNLLGRAVSIFVEGYHLAALLFDGNLRLPTVYQ